MGPTQDATRPLSSSDEDTEPQGTGAQCVLGSKPEAQIFSLLLARAVTQVGNLSGNPRSWPGLVISEGWPEFRDAGGQRLEHLDKCQELSNQVMRQPERQVTRKQVPRPPRGSA